MEREADAYGLRDILPALRSAILPTVAFSLDPSGRSSSRFGGAPRLPQDFVWPTYVPSPVELPASVHSYFGITEPRPVPGIQPLDFLLQVDLAELQQFDCARVLPRSGLLTFFYDIDESPWGFNPARLGGFHVALFNNQDLVETAPPRGERLAARTMRFCESCSLPQIGSRAYDALERSVELPESYFDFVANVERKGCAESNGLHRLLGHSSNVQGDMQLEAQLVSNGLYCGDESGYNDPRRIELERGAEEWMLLLQLDSDESAAMMWGDAGMLYFWIRKSDLAAHRFDRCWMTLQCG